MPSLVSRLPGVAVLRQLCAHLVACPLGVAVGEDVRPPQRVGDEEGEHQRPR